MSEYIDKLVSELSAAGVAPSNVMSKQEARQAELDDFNTSIIKKIEDNTGVSFSDEQRAILKHTGSACILACAGSGKALANYEPVYTERGWVPIGKLTNSDRVYGIDGYLHSIVGIFPQGLKRKYSCHFSNGVTVDCNDEHIWQYWEYDKSLKTYIEKVNTLGGLLSKYKVNNNRVELSKNVFIESASPLKSHTNVINDCNEVNDMVYKYLSDTDRCVTLTNIVSAFKKMFKSSSVTDISLTCRAEIISNLIKSYAETDKPDKLLNTYATRVFNEILGTLGVTRYSSNGSFEYLADDPEITARLNDIMDNRPTGNEKVYMESVDITDEEVEMTCICVDAPEHLYITRGFIPTHNTTISVNLIIKRIMTGEINPDKLLFTTYSKAGTEEMKERIDKLLSKMHVHKRVQVRTLHSFFLSVLRDFGVSNDIIKDSKRLKFIREACKDAGYVLHDDSLTQIDTLLSYQVNNMLNDQETIESYVNSLDDLRLNQYKTIRSGYASRKAKERLIDYDDMQSYLYVWLVRYAKSTNQAEYQTCVKARNYCRALYDYFFIDEAQDISKIQYEIIKALVTPLDNPDKLDKTLILVGDDDQCLIEGTKVLLGDTYENIENLDWCKVTSATGHGETGLMQVTDRSSKHIDDDIVVIKTKSGKVIKGTHNHIGFARIVPDETAYYTYLMYKHGIGFRIGTTSGVRTGIRGELANGLRIRLMQERADKLWVLRVSNTLAESRYYEAYFAYKYSIPMYRFETSDLGNGLPTTTLNHDMVVKLHQELGTLENGYKLLEDLRLDSKFPHRVPQAEGERCKLNFTMMSSVAKDKYGIHKSEMSINSSNEKFVDVFSQYLSVSDHKSRTKYNYKNGRITTSDLDKHTYIMDNIVNDCGENNIYLEVSREAKITNEKYMEMPFGNMFRGMIIPVYDNGELIDDVIVSVEKEHYCGNVYDIEVPATRNFIANDIVVHNCIYQWRGSDPSIILSVGPKFDIQTFVLSTNYRCRSAIVDYATTGVKCNSSRYDKSMNAFKTGGDVKIAVAEKEDLLTLSKIALNHIKYWIANGENESDIAVLCRNNFHLALLSSMLFKEGIPCVMTDDMKLTKSFYFKDVETIMNIIDFGGDATEVGSILWKMCLYMKATSSRAIGNLMDNTGLDTRQALGYILKNICGIDVSTDTKINIPTKAEMALQYSLGRMSQDTVADLIKIYVVLSSDKTKEEKFRGLLLIYFESTSKYLYKSKDKQRSVIGISSYFVQIAKESGFEALKDFVRYSKQYESSSAVIMGDPITLVTEHSSKGREWKNVIMFACDNVSQPSIDGIKKLRNDGVSVEDIFANIDEERRLHYVGNTRAKNNLLVITYNNPSMFILEALGVIKDNCNQKIYDIAMGYSDEIIYADDVRRLIQDKSSPYYYDAEKYKV